MRIGKVLRGVGKIGLAAGCVAVTVVTKSPPSKDDFGNKPWRTAGWVVKEMVKDGIDDIREGITGTDRR